MEDFAVGIDLGTTYSCVAVFRNNEVKIIENNFGDSTTPSHVHFDDEGYITVGKTAKTQTTFDPATVIYDVKRLIGRRFDDPVLQSDLKLWPFKVINKDNSPLVEVRGELHHPEQISAEILAYLKTQAENYLRCPIKKAVITVPAYFNDGQRQATKDAGKLAGLEVLRIVNEPTAAAIAYCYKQPLNQTQKNILVFDLGGGTFDLAVISMEGGQIEVKAVGGDTHLGGEDIDKNIANFCLDEFFREHQINLSDHKDSADELKRQKSLKVLRRLKNKCEDEKINLTVAPKTVVNIDSARGELDLAVKLTREKFNQLNQHLFDQCLGIVGQVLKDAQLSPEDIDDVILVGGSSKTPKIIEMLRAHFGDRSPCTELNGSEAVAYGASILAALLNEQTNQIELKDKHLLDLKIRLRDVVPLSIGVSAFDPLTDRLKFFPIVHKNCPVPCVERKKFETRLDNQSIIVRVYEGESGDPERNHFLGMFAAENLPFNCPKGEPYWVNVEVNEEGIVEVTATYRASVARDKLQLMASKGRLKKDELLQLRKKHISTDSFREMRPALLQ